jgi:hypothetical protein
MYDDPQHFSDGAKDFIRSQDIQTPFESWRKPARPMHGSNESIFRLTPLQQADDRGNSEPAASPIIRIFR